MIKLVCDILPKYEKEFNLVKKEYWEQIKILKPEKGLKNVENFISKAKWAWNNLEPKMHIKFGNNKLPPTICIVNIGTWFNCSGRKEGFCEICKKCYDKSPEVRFKERTKDRLEHEIYWRSVDAKTFALELCKKIIQHNYNNRQKKLIIKTKLIRWSEVGEIRNQKDLEKIVEISNIVYNILKIESYIYTHNQSLNFNIDRPHLTINGSNFMVDNEYRVVKNKEEEYNNLNNLSNKRDCICDCYNCNGYCYNKNGFIIIEELR